MKKISTTVIGMDLGDRRSELCALDSEGDVIWRRRLKTRAPALQEFFSTLPPTRVIIEVGTHSPWVSRLLTKLGHEVVVANAHQVKLIGHATYKNDKRDAELLARLGRVDVRLLAPIQHRTEEAQADLLWVRTRAALVESRTELINHVRGAVKSQGYRLRSCSAESFYKLEADIPEELAATLSAPMELIKQLSLKIRDHDREIKRLCDEKYPITKGFQRIRGVGPITALTYVLVLGSAKRFRRSRWVGSYLGLCPAQSQSSDSNPELPIAKRGDRYLRMLLVQCAHYILTRGQDSDLLDFGLRIFNQGGKKARKRAAVAVARKLAVVLHRLWVTGEAYHPRHAQKRYGTAPAKTYRLEAA
jgi:transposase